MASFLRSLVAGPRRPHSETGLDLCYVHESNPCLIVMSVPASTYPKKAYRNPLSEIVAYLDKVHGDRWSVWEFRAEGTGYDDSEMHNRIYHAPWPDHQPPPFALIPNVMGTMRDHLKGGDKDKEGGERVAVLHCKAGKGRSGTMASAYLIAEEGWESKDALARFTKVRMRPGFGEGVSIKSQLRWIEYIEKWARELDKAYVDSEIEILEVRVWGLRDNTKILVDGYKEEGKVIHTFHTFTSEEVIDMPEDTPGYLSPDLPNRKRSSRLSLRSPKPKRSSSSARSSTTNLPEGANPTTAADNLTPATPASAFPPASTVPTAPITDTAGLPVNPPPITPSTIITEHNDTAAPSNPDTPSATPPPPTYPNVICRPSRPIIIPNSDACISFSSSTSLPLNLSLVTSIAYFWFNAYFYPSNTIALTWEELDGLKGTYRKGFRALDRVEVVFRRVPGHDRIVKEPKVGESRWEDMPGKAEAHVDGLGVGEKGGWVRTKRQMEEQGLDGEGIHHDVEEHTDANTDASKAGVNKELEAEIKAEIKKEKTAEAGKPTTSS